MAVALLPGQKTLAQIRLWARQKADQVLRGAPPVAYPDPYANSFATTPELDARINDLNNELFGLMVVEYGNYYTASRYNFTASGAKNQEFYPLPQDFLKLQGLDYVQSPGSNLTNLTLRNFMIRERNQFNYPYFSGGVAGPYTSQYALQGKQIWFKPAPVGGNVYQILYVPLPLLLADCGQLVMNGVVAGTSVTIADALSGASVTFTAIAFGATPSDYHQFVVGGTGAANLGDAGTAASLAAQLNASPLGGLSGVLAATATTSDAGTPDVVIILTGPAQITWSVSSSKIILSPNQASGPGAGFNDPLTLVATAESITWTNVMNGYSGWWEYLALGATIDLVSKEEGDPTAWGIKFEALKQRIKKECDNRDQGASARVVDVYGNGGGSGRGGLFRAGDDY